MPNDKAKELTARELIALKRGDEFEPVATCKDYLQVQNELKPCPSCGAKNTDKVTHITELYDADKYKYGRCYMCGLKMYSWNTRPIEDALQARIAELEAAQDVQEENQTSLKAEIAQLQAEISQLKKDKLEFNAQCFHKDETISVLENRITELQADNRSLVEQMNEMAMKIEHKSGTAKRR